MSVEGIFDIKEVGFRIKGVDEFREAVISLFFVLVLRDIACFIGFGEF